MPASKRKMATKAVLLAPVGPIMAWGVEKLLSGEAVTGGVALVIGTAFTLGFVAVNEYDIPYEDEILSVVADQTTQGEITDTATEAASRVGDSITDPSSDDDEAGDDGAT